MLRNLSTGIEASATGESLNSGDVAVHPAARHNSQAQIISDFQHDISIPTASISTAMPSKVTLNKYVSTSLEHAGYQERLMAPDQAALFACMTRNLLVRSQALE